MAGDWIPYTFDLPRKREVAALSRICRLRRREVVAIVLEFWAWASTESTDGYLAAITLEQLPDLIPDTKPAFWEAMASKEIGWVIVVDGGLRVPRWERWLGKPAKLRLQERDKKRRQRARGGPDDVPLNTGHPSPDRPACPPSTGEREGEESITSPKEGEVSTAAPAGKPTDSEWLEALAGNPAYGHVDVPGELARMDAWLSVNPQRKKTRRFIVNWLNRIERPVAPGNGNGVVSRAELEARRRRAKLEEIAARLPEDGEKKGAADVA